MQALAKEMNFARRVFVLPPQAEDADVRIRIFTPATELPFAGHPTLGTAFVLGGPLQKIVLRLETGAGVVPVELEREGAGIRVRLDGAADPDVGALRAGRRAARGARRRALRAAGRAVPPRPEPRLRRARLRRAGRRARPELRALVAVTDAGVNCFARDGAGWKTRMFAPGDGVAEDPATGSAAGPLAIHLARHGRIAFGEEIEISQGIEIGRPSKLYARVEGEGDRIERVRVGGSAVIVARGEFRIP